MPQPLQRLAPLIALALLLWASTPFVARAATPTPAPPAADSAISFTARAGYEGGFRPGSWMPIVFELENSGVDRSVELRVGGRDGVQYATRVELPNQGRKAITVYAYLTPASRRLTARVLSEGQELASQVLALQPVNPNARVVAVLLPDGASLRPPARLNSATPLVAIPLRPADLPEQALGLSGFGALLIEDVPTAALSDRQRAALREWVLRGGQLLLGGGAGLEQVLAGLPPELAPATVGATAPVAADSLLGPDMAGAAPIPLAALTARSATPAPYRLPLTSLSGAGDLALEQTFGRGTITAVAFPLAHPALTGWQGAPALWADLVRANNELPAGFAPDNVTADSFVEGNLASSLTSLPALEFPPLGLLAGLVITYIVLVGPVTYLVLRRLDRQSLGWVVVPMLTAIFAALTYGVGVAQRGGEVLLNQITLVEPVGHEGAARTRSFVGVFSPERRSYRLDASEATSTAPLLRPISLNGPWDNSAGTAKGVFVQDVAPGAEGFEIAQWSMRAVAADAIVPGPVTDAKLIVDGDTLLAEVTNRGAAPLQDVAVVQGEQVVRLGDIAPGETRGGELKRFLGLQPVGGTTPMSYLIYREEMDRQSKMGGQPLPPDLQRRIRILDALYNYGPSNRGGQPILVAWSDHAALDLTPSNTRADYERMAVLTLTPRVELAGPAVQLNTGWLTLRYEGGPATACFGSQGAGVTLAQEPAVIRLVLPRELYGLRADKLTLTTAGDSPWAPGSTLELYDWTSGSWVAQELPAGELVVATPERFLSSNGALRARLTSGQPMAGPNCVYVDAKIEGSLP